MIETITKPIRLTQFSPGAGWACKLSPSDLAQVLGNLKIDLPENTIGFESSEDCAVVPLDKDHYLLQSVDFFTPIVDDPYTFGQIAAANSLSDIYAMGGKPLHALNIAEFPVDDLVSWRQDIHVIFSIHYSNKYQLNYPSKQPLQQARKHVGQPFK